MSQENTGLQYVSAFLSHSNRKGYEPRFFEFLAEELGKRGVLPWLDRHRFHEGDFASKHIKDAIESQSLFVLFMSKKSMGDSEWVAKEVGYALEREKREESSYVFPILLDGDPRELISSHPVCSEWMDRVGKGVERVYEDKPANLHHLSEQESLQRQKAARLADKIARKVYSNINETCSKPKILFFEQRGEGERVGPLPVGLIPSALRRDNLPVLTFRYNDKKNDRKLVMLKREWDDFKKILNDNLLNYLGTPSDGKSHCIHLIGQTQLSLALLIGTVLRCREPYLLYAENPPSKRFPRAVFSNESFDKSYTPGEGRVLSESVEHLEDGNEHEEVCLLLLKEHFKDDAEEWIEDNLPSKPVVWIGHGDFLSNDELTAHIKDIVETLYYLKQKPRRVKKVYLFSSWPWSALAILGACLDFSVERISFMERRHKNNEYIEFKVK